MPSDPVDPKALAAAQKAAREWIEGYGIRTEPYTRSGGDHPMMDTLPEAFLAFAAALADPAPDRGEAMRALEADAARFRYLRDFCSSHYAMTWEQPAEWSISWEFQQSKPDEAYGSLEGWIDEDIQRQAALDADDEAALPLASPNEEGGS